MKKRIYSFWAITVSLLILFGINTVYASSKVPIASLNMVVNKASIQVNEVIMLTVIVKPMNTTEDIVWSTTNKSIATVNKYGVVTGIKPGKVTVSAKASNGLKATCKITVKKYLSESDLSDLISKKTLTEEQILKLIKKNGLSKDQTLKLISENTLSETLINELIKQNSISKDDIIAMIDKKAESLKQYVYISSGLSSGISESEARSIYRSEMFGNWNDGVELTNETSIMPVTGGALTIDSIRITKEHYSGKYDNRTQKYRYKVEFEGKINYSNNPRPTIDIDYYSINNVAPNDSRWYPIKSNLGVSNNLDVIESSIDETGHFKCVIYQYNIYCDYDTYVLHFEDYEY